MKKLLFLAALSSLSAFAVPVADVKVRTLDDFGGDLGSVLARCQTKKGVEYDEVTVTRDVTTLNASKEFQEIYAEANEVKGGVEVIFNVRRKMRYHGPMEVKGANFYTESRIRTETGLKDGELYGDGDFATAASKVRKVYLRKHFPDCKVMIVPSLLPGGNDCHVTVVVDEGVRARVGAYRFDGVTGVDHEELRTAIGVFPWWDPRGWFGEEPLSRDQLANASEKVRAFLADRGYLDAKVTDVRRVPSETGDDRYDVAFTVSEGPLYRIGSSKITGLKRYPESVVAAKSGLPKEGDVAGEQALRDAAHRVQVTVGSGDCGLADTVAEFRCSARRGEPGVVDIEYKVTEGVPVVIRKVVIEGNEYTKDKVIRREIKVDPGDPMREDVAERSQSRLEGLDYFSRVRHFLRNPELPKDEKGREWRDLVYEVEEKNTGSFMVGVGASSVDSVYLSAEVSQSNFDLFAPRKMFRGGGQKARLYAQCGPRIQSYEASINEPYFLDRLLDLTVEGYRRQRWYDDYDIIRTGGSASLAYPMRLWNPFNGSWREFGKFGVRWTGEIVDFDDIEHGPWRYKGRTVSLDDEKRRYGNAFESVFRAFWGRDTRDRQRMPSRGQLTQVYADFACGDNEYWKLGFQHRSYFTVVRKYRHVLMVAARAETIDAFSGEVPIYDRLFLGGPKSIRGLEYRHVSPFAQRYKNEELSDRYMPWGGQTLFCMNFEYTIPVVQMLRLAAFTDLGSVGEKEFDLDFDDTFAWTAGLGIRLDVPMFPIRLDFAAPIKKPDHADREVFSFTVGYDF